MNRSKKLYILLGVLAVACAATFVVTQMEEQKEQIKETGEIILELPAESVQSLSWEYNENSLAFHRDEIWLYDEDENFPVSEEKINNLLEQFQAFGAAFIIEDVEDFGQYGLDDPVCTISLSTEDQDYEIKLGDYSKMDSQRYVSIGDGNVYLVKHDPLDGFNATIRNLIDHDEVPEFDRVTGISFSGSENYSVTYEEESADTYREEDVYFVRQDGRNLPLDTHRVQDYLDYIGYLNLTDYVAYHAAEEELSAYGLDTPELTVTVNYTVEEDGQERSDTFVLHVSQDPEEKKSSQEQEEDDKEGEITAYARVGDSQIVYQISSAGYKHLMAASYDDLRHLEVLPTAFEDVRQVAISLEGSRYTLTSEKDGKEQVWAYQGEELEIDSFRNALNALTADEFTTETPSGKEEISLTLSLDREDAGEVQIQLYRYDGEHCIASVDGESVCLVKRAAAVDLIEAVHAIVLD